MKKRNNCNGNKEIKRRKQLFAGDERKFHLRREEKKLMVFIFRGVWLAVVSTVTDGMKNISISSYWLHEEICSHCCCCYLLCNACMHQFIENAGKARLTNIMFVRKVSFSLITNRMYTMYYCALCSAEANRKRRNAHQVLGIYACDEFYNSAYTETYKRSYYKITEQQSSVQS